MGQSGPSDPGRRRTLIAIGWLPLAFTAAGALAGCSRDEQGPGGPPMNERSGAAGTGGGESGAADSPAEGAGSGAGSGVEDDPEYTLVTRVDSMKPVVEALQYANESPRSDQQCANCIYYTPETAKRGRCSLFQTGFVMAGGWCTSWKEKPLN